MITKQTERRKCNEELELRISIYPPPERLQAFTLAEVLITLVIIGVIAAITVPSLMNNTNGQEYRSKFKKAISGVNQALTLHYALDGLSARDYTSETDLVKNVFEKRMNVIEIDENTFSEGYNIKYHDSSEGTGIGCVPTSENSFVTQDGVVFCATNWYGASSDKDPSGAMGERCDPFNKIPCAGLKHQPNLFIDVNGEKKPNKATTNSSQPKDQYEAVIYNTKVVPYGVGAEIMYEKK